MPKMTPAQKSAARDARAKGADEDAINDAIADAAPEEESDFAADFALAGTPEGDADAEAAQREMYEAKGKVVDAEIVEEPKAVAKTTRTRAIKTEVTISESSLFVPLEDTDEHYNILWWGREGSGKSTDLASAANLGRILIINAEGGLKKRPLINRGINLANIMVWPRPGEDITYDGFLEVYHEIKADLMNDPKSWFAIGIDSITEVSEVMTGDVTDDRNAKIERKTDSTLAAVDKFFVDRSDYGTSGRMMRDILKKLRDLPVHLLISALERRDVDEDTSKVAYGPAVPPGLQKDVLGYVDIVLYSREPDEENDFYRALTKKAGKFRSKDRLDALPRVLVNPTFERVLGYIDETLDGETDPVQTPLAEAEARKAAAPKKETPAQKRARLAREKKESEAPTSD